MKYEKTKKTIREANYKEIIESFESLLFENDNEIEKVSMNDVASRADFTKRTLYKYFDGKNELLFEVMIRGYHTMHQYLDNAKTGGSNTLELRTVAQAFYQFSKDHPHYFHLIMDYNTRQSDFENPSERVMECYKLGQATMEYIVTAIQNGVSQGVFRQDLNILEATLQTWAFAVGVLNTMSLKLDYVHEYYKIDRDEFVTNAFEQIINMLQ